VCEVEISVKEKQFEKLSDLLESIPGYEESKNKPKAAESVTGNTNLGYDRTFI
jgi:hypothetical protein